MFAAIGQKTNYLQMSTLPLRLQIPQFTSEYRSRKINRFVYNFLYCKPSLFILHKPHSLNHCLYGFMFFIDIESSVVHLSYI